MLGAKPSKKANLAQGVSLGMGATLGKWEYFIATALWWKANFVDLYMVSAKKTPIINIR